MKDIHNSSGTLEGIPYIGVARRTFLAANGITTRAQLAALASENLASMARMPHGHAESVLRYIGVSVPTTTADSPMEQTIPASALVVSPPRTVAKVDTVVLRAREALSDIARQERALLEKSVRRYAAVLDDAATNTSGLRPRALRRLVKRVERVTIRLERFAAQPKKKEKPLKRLRDFLKQEVRQSKSLLEMTVKKPAAI